MKARKSVVSLQFYILKWKWGYVAFLIIKHERELHTLPNRVRRSRLMLWWWLFLMPSYKSKPLLQVSSAQVILQDRLFNPLWHLQIHCHSSPHEALQNQPDSPPSCKSTPPQVEVLLQILCSSCIKYMLWNGQTDFSWLSDSWVEEKVQYTCTYICTSAVIE